MAALWSCMLEICGNVCELLIGKVCAAFPGKLSYRSIVIISHGHMSCWLLCNALLFKYIKKMAVLVI